MAAVFLANKACTYPATDRGDGFDLYQMEGERTVLAEVR
jgi:hypothetical protein